MAKAPINVPAPPAPPAPDTPPELTAPSAGTEPAVPPPPPEPPSPTDTPVGTEPGSTPADDGTGLRPASNQEAIAAAADTPVSDTPANGPGEIDGGVNGPVTREAELHGAVKASDYKTPPAADGEFEFDARATEAQKTEFVAKAGFKAGRYGRPVGQRRKSFTDNQWSRYQASHARGVIQGEADKLSPIERLERLERASGLAIPGAVIYAEDDE